MEVRLTASDASREQLCYYFPMSNSTTVPCPICGKLNDFFTDPLGPFCSQRCKLVDLGKWFSEEYKVSEPLRAEHFAEYEHLESSDALDRPEREGF